MYGLSFSYLSSREINSAESMLRLGTHALKVLSDHYVLTSIINTPRNHDCPIHEILYSDIEKYGTVKTKKAYQDLVEKYGQDICDLVFPKDENFIMDKIYRTILFAMDKVYNCDKLMVTVRGNINNSRFDQSSIPQLVYGSIQEHFDIVELRTSPERYEITITKKRKGDTT